MMAVSSTFSHDGPTNTPPFAARSGYVCWMAAVLAACGAIGTAADPRVTADKTGSAGSNVHATGSAGTTTVASGATGTGGQGGAGGTSSTSATSTSGSSGSAGSGGTGAGGSGSADAGSPGPAASCGTLSRRVFAGDFADASWLSSWDPNARIMFGENNVERIADAQFGSVLRVHYPAGSVNPGTTPVGGTQFKSRFAATESICLSYWLRFDPKFDFVKGGKLPGLCGGDCPSGGEQTNGQTGWSTRYMWRRDGAGEVYAYILPAEAFGTELGEGKWTFVPGAWHHLEQMVTLNAPGQTNGSVRVWYDRKETDSPDFEARDLVYRTVSTLKIDQIFFSTFFGGSDPTWATPVATYVDFAHFELFE